MKMSFQKQSRRRRRQSHRDFENRGGLPKCRNDSLSLHSGRVCDASDRAIRKPERRLVLIPAFAIVDRQAIASPILGTVVVITKFPVPLIMTAAASQ